MVDSSIDFLPTALQRRVSRLAKEANIEPETLLAKLVEIAIDGIAKQFDAHSQHSSFLEARLSPNELVDIETASLRMKISKSKLAAMRCQGIGPKFVKMGARTVYYRIGDIDRYLQDRTVQSTSQW